VTKNLKYKVAMRRRCYGVRVSRARRWGRSLIAVTLIFSFALFSAGEVLLTDSLRAASNSISAPVQLVRLNVVRDAGLVRIEIIADGSLAETTIEPHTRGRNTIVRLRSAQSLLQQRYAIGDTLVDEVRVVSRGSGPNSTVEIAISTGEGATIAQRVNFNRLIIGVAADFARLRRPRAGESDLARRNRPSPGNQIPNNQARRSEASSTTVLPPNVESNAQNVETPNPPTVAQNSPSNVFRGRTIWNSFAFPTAPRISRLSSFVFSAFPQGTDRSSTQSSEALFGGERLEAPGLPSGVFVPGTSVAIVDEAGGLQFGRGFLRPSFSLGAEYDDSFSYLFDTEERIAVFTFAPRLEYEIPGETAGLRVGYEPRIRRLTNGEWAIGHFFDFDGRFDMTPSTRLAFRNYFVRSSLDSREYDPANETYIVGQTFTRNDAALRFEGWTSERSRVGLEVGYNIIRFDVEDLQRSPPIFLDYGDFQTTFFYERDLSEQTTAIVSLRYGNTIASAPLRPQFDGLNNHRRYQIEIGGRSQLSETDWFAARIGYERSDFYRAPVENDYSGLIFDVNYRRDLTESTNFELAALRKTQISSFNLEGGNARLTSTGLALRFGWDLTEQLNFGFGGDYQRLRFPVAVIPETTASGGVIVIEAPDNLDLIGERRRDNLYGLTFDTEFSFSDLVGAEFVYGFYRRDSRFPIFTYDGHRLAFVLQIGRRSERRGRIF
jgi:hypothetical protein